MFYISVSAILRILAFLILIIGAVLYTMEFEKMLFIRGRMSGKSLPPGIYPVADSDQVIMLNSKCILVLGHTLAAAQILLRELAEENRDEVVRYCPDRIFFRDGYLFLARSVNDPDKILGIMFSQVIYYPLCVSDESHAYLDIMMDRFCIPKEFRWIPVSF